MSLFQGTVIKRGRTVWDKELLPPEEYEKRLASVQGKMADLNLQALLVYGDNSYCGDLCYLSNYSPFIAWREGFMLVPPTGLPDLFLKITPRDLFYIQDFTWANVAPSRNLADDCSKRLAEWGVKGTIGLIGGEKVTWAFQRSLEKALAGRETIPVNDFYRQMRDVKRPQEMLVQSRGRQIIQEALQHAAAMAAPGLDACELAASVDRLARLHGCEDVQLLLGGSGAGYALGPVTSRSLEAGEFVTVFLAVQYQRYWVAGGATIAIGSGWTELIDKVQETLGKTAASLSPGSTSGQAYMKASQVIAETAEDGWGGFALGGGIGLDLEERPVLTAGDATVLKSGMVLNLRVMLTLAGKPCFASDTYVLEERGARIV